MHNEGTNPEIKERNSCRNYAEKFSCSTPAQLLIITTKLDNYSPTEGYRVYIITVLFYRFFSLQIWSGQQDLNLRPPAPKAGALPNCAMPRIRLIISYSQFAI